MRKLLVLGAVAIAVFPAASSAQLAFGVRAGFAAAMGDYAENDPQTETVTSQIPLQIDAMYGLTRAFSAGAYFSYGFGRLNGDERARCRASGLDCSASVTRLGLQAEYAFEVSPQLAPWAGAGVGLEWLGVTRSIGGVSGTADTFGLEIVNLQGGADYRLSDRLSVGAYLLFSIGQYSSKDGNGIASKGLHEWLNLGVRGRLDL